MGMYTDDLDQLLNSPVVNTQKSKGCVEMKGDDTSLFKGLCFHSSYLEKWQILAWAKACYKKI